MLYHSYKEKLEQRMRTLDKIWKFRFLILAALVLLIALIVTLCSVAGNIYAQSCPSAVEYGTPLDFRAKAVLGKVTPEYRAKGAAEWTSEQPVRVGEYEVRAVSNGATGKKYGTVFSYSVLPREAQIGLADTFFYGEDPAVTASLAYADVIADAEYDYRGKADQTFEVTVRVNRIVNEAGEDVTDCYTLSALTSEAERLARPVVLKAESAQKVYDGTPLSAPACSTEEGSLAAGDSMECVWPSQTDVGKTDNTPALVIRNEAGEDVTDLYAVEWLPSSLEVLPREIVLHAASAEKVYDGTPLTAEGVRSDENTPFVSGHIAQIAVCASITRAGSIPNLPTYVVFDETGRDVTANYSFRSGSGTLTVTPRPITVQTASRTWIYDGNGHSAAGIGDYAVSAQSPYGLVEGQTLAPTNASVIRNTLYSVTDSVTEVRYAENALLFTVTAEDGSDVTDCYAFSYEYGRLRIKTEIIVTFYPVSKYYDGTTLALTEEDYAVVKPPDVAVECSFPALTDAGTIDTDQLDSACVSATDPVTGQDVMADNRLRYESFGKPVLEILPRPIEVSSISVSAEWNGSPLYGNSVSGAFWISLGSLVVGQTIEVELTGVLQPTQFYSVQNTIASVTIRDRNGEDVTANYDISTKSGWLQWRQD